LNPSGGGPRTVTRRRSRIRGMKLTLVLLVVGVALFIILRRK
jgi:hypothetical protein